MSVRSFSGALMSNSAFSTAASSGSSTYLPKFSRSLFGVVRLNLSLSPAGMTTSLTSGLPRRETWTHLPFDPLFELNLAFVTSSLRRSTASTS